MPVQFRDYYETLGVSKTATSDDIRKAFRKLARQYHPDVAKDKKGAEEKFKQINEAYEVLSDKAKREKYDLLGADWQQWRTGRRRRQWTAFGRAGVRRPRGRRACAGRRAASEYDFSGTGYSDFFEQFFGGKGGRRAGTAGFPGAPGGAGFDFFGNQPPAAERGADVEADISVTLEEALRGSKRSVSLRRTDARGPVKTETYDVKIPAGVHEGQRIRLKFTRRGRARVAGNLATCFCACGWPRTRISGWRPGGDLYHDLTVAPWQAVLGGEVTVPTLEGPMKLKIPPGSQVGRRFRLRGRGTARRRAARGRTSTCRSA